MADNDWEKAQMSPTWDFKEEKEFVGIYEEMEEGVGPNQSSLYHFKTEEGRISIWGNSVLDARLRNIKQGEEVKIVYLGLVESKKRKGAKYHNFEVYHRMLKKEEKEEEEESIDADDIPF